MDSQGLHAYIISGADLAERESLAYILALKALGGKNYSEALPGKLIPASKLADTAPASTDAPAFAHPDLHEISPDGAEIKVAQAREVRDMAQIRPNEAERQVFIFHEADRMNNSAQNALLATIEEPSTPCLFLLVCANERALLPTIRSRCAVLHATASTLREYGVEPSRPAADPAPARSAEIDPAAASRMAQALMLSLSAVDSAEAVLPLSKLKGDAASELIDAARAACLRTAARSPAGSDEALRALAGADFAAKCLDLLSANVSPAQVASYIVAHAER